MATDPEQLCMKNINYRRIRLIEEILTLNDLYERLADWQNNFDRFSLPYLAPFPGLDWMIYLAEATGKNGHDGRWHQNSQFMSDGNRTSNPLYLTCVIPWNYMQPSDRASYTGGTVNLKNTPKHTDFGLQP